MPHQDYVVGDIVNDHVLIGEEWVPVRHAEHSEGSTYEPGDVVNGHVWTGADWVATRAGKAPKKPGFSERLSIAREQLEQEQAQKKRKSEAKAAKPKKPSLSERLEAKSAELERKQEAREQRSTESSSTFQECGPLVAKGSVAGRRIEIYEKGFIRIGMLKLGEPERLIGISAQDQTQQKTGPGRALAAGLTFGTNLITTSNKRGSLYLIIVTDKKTHSLTMSPPTNSDLKAMHKLEAAGRAVLAALEAQRQVASSQTEPASIPTGLSLAEQLTQLTDLHKAGALSDDEFAAAKAQLLSGGGA